VSRAPRASRPRFPDYGISRETEGMLGWEWATERLASARSYWVCTVRADGRPHAMPVWGLWFDDAVVFSTDPASQKGRNLAREPRVVVHLESAEEAVILEGLVEPTLPGEAVLDAYEAKYAVRPGAGGGWFALRPDRAFAWREHDYPTSATRFDF
jgi:Pyridoxamine 5'-phosphate oxidase